MQPVYLSIHVKLKSGFESPAFLYFVNITIRRHYYFLLWRKNSYKSLVNEGITFWDYIHLVFSCTLFVLITFLELSN